MYDLDSTIRTLTATESLAKIMPQSWTDFGITRVANITGLDNIGIPVYISIRPNSKSLSVSQGKGITDELAKISAVMESIETWHAENIESKKIIFTDTYANLKNQNAVENPNQFIASSDDLQNIALDWIEVLDLITHNKKYLPLQLFSLDMTQRTQLTQIFSPTSNGLASGNSYEEALCHSLCELIERDAVAHWLQLSEIEQDKNLIDLTSITDSTIRVQIAKVLSANLNIYIWDIENNLGIPTYYCSITDNQQSPYTLFTGSGAHFSNKVALLRAITEAAQARLTYISGSRDDVFPDFYSNFDPSEIVTELLATKASSEYCARPWSFTSFTAVNDHLIEKLIKYNVKNIYMFEHTRTMLDVAVVHSIAPDLWSE